MIEVKITKQQMDRARQLYEFNILKNSVLNGDGNLTGALGEIVVFDYYYKKGRYVVHSQDRNFDLLIDGFRIEIKTKGVNTIPKPDHTCHVSDYNSTQECHFYCFVNVFNDHSKAYIKGLISRSRFNEIKQLKKQGDFDGTFQFKCDTWIVLNKNLLI